MYQGFRDGKQYKCLLTGGFCLSHFQSCPLVHTSPAPEKEHDIFLASRSVANYTVRTRLLCLNSSRYITNQFPRTANIYRLMRWAYLWKYRARGKKFWYFPCLSTRSRLSDEKSFQRGTPAHCLTLTLYLWCHTPGAMLGTSSSNQ